MEAYIASKYENRNKIKTPLLKYEFMVGGRRCCFYFELAEHAAFMSARAPELEELINGAIEREPRERHFEYTGSHFEPLSDRSWVDLNWKGV